MDEPGLLKDCEGIEKLRSEDLDKLRAKTLELVLLDQLVQV